jgi:hypothetical protein
MCPNMGVYTKFYIAYIQVSGQATRRHDNDKNINNNGNNNDNSKLIRLFGTDKKS